MKFFSKFKKRLCELRPKVDWTFFRKLKKWLTRGYTQIVKYSFLIGLILFIIGPPWQSIWQIIFPPTPFISTDKIIIPPFASEYQEEISIINPSEKAYTNITIRFESMDDFSMSSSSFIIEPKEHSALTTLENFGDVDSNFIAAYDEDKNVYLKISRLKAKEEIGYIIRIKNADKDTHSIRISLDKHEVLEQLDTVPFLLYLITSMLTENNCNGEEYPEGLFGQGRRINSCFGGLVTSNITANIMSIHMWLHPEWKQNEINFIFDSYSDITKSKISLYRNDEFIITEIIESNGHEHVFREKVNFSEEWNNVYFSLNPNEKSYVLYLNNYIVINYTFKEIYFEMPTRWYFGANSKEASKDRYFGNFILDEVSFYNATLTKEDIDIMYHNAIGTEGYGTLGPIETRPD